MRLKILFEKVFCFEREGIFIRCITLNNLWKYVTLPEVLFKSNSFFFLIFISMLWIKKENENVLHFKETLYKKKTWHPVKINKKENPEIKCKNL